MARRILRHHAAICLAAEIGLAIAVVVAVLALSILLAYAQEPWQLGCKIRTGVGVATIVIGAMSVGACVGLVMCGLLRGIDHD